MDLLDLPNLAKRATMPLSLARYYRDRFILFVPCVRIGRTIMHPPEAVQVLVTIRDLAASGMTTQEIEGALGDAFPVTVISAQESTGGSVSGASTNAIQALAASLDERGTRLECEVFALRDLVAGRASAHQLTETMFDVRLATESISHEVDAQHRRLQASFDEIRSRMPALASREQLEWIGDVVAAAALRPPQVALDSAIERRLQEIHDDLVKPRVSDDLSEVLAAIHQLAERFELRDQSLHRVFETLSAAIQLELSAMHCSVSELRENLLGQRAEHEERAAQHRSVLGDGEVHNGDHSFQYDRASETGRQRSLRRMGQTPRVRGD